MTTTPHPTRREFLRQTALATATLAIPAVAAAPATDSRRYTWIVFSKAFQQLDAEATADFVAEVGWDGIECPVRKGGQVTPERVEEDLPRLVAALAKRNKVIGQITTDARNATDPLTQRVLRTASRLGIRQYRLAASSYRNDTPIPAQLAELRSQLRDLVALNRELGLWAGFQNHSGTQYIGAAVWDIWEVVRDLDPAGIGVCFDIGHATVEGGHAWSTHARLMEPWMRAVYVKDFAWQKTGQGWEPVWCPVGEGMIQRRFFDWLRQTRFQGPVSQHFEYPLGTRAEMAARMKRDLATLRTWLKE